MLGVSCRYREDDRPGLGNRPGLEWRSESLEPLELLDEEPLVSLAEDLPEEAYECVFLLVSPTLCELDFLGLLGRSPCARIGLGGSIFLLDFEDFFLFLGGEVALSVCAELRTSSSM